MSKLIQLEDNEISMILGALGQGPYQMVAALIKKISDQSNGAPSGTQSNIGPAGSLDRRNGGLTGNHMAGSEGQDKASLTGVGEAVSPTDSDATADEASVYKAKNS